MPTAVLDVSLGAYEEVARVLGEVIPAWVGMAWSDVVSGLGGTYGMAGSDPAGQAWGASYQDAADGACAAAADLMDASRWLASLVAQTGDNYAVAEGTSIVGATAGLFPELASAKRFAAGPSVASTLRGVQTAIGTGSSAPFGWSLLEHAIGRVWPNGHQDLLHVASRVWRAAGAEVRSLVEGVDRAVAGMRAVRAPEVDSIVTLVSGVSRHVTELGRLFEQLGDSCAQYAHHLDQAHHAILAEVKSFLEWSAGIEVVSGLFAVVTLGASEGVGQAGEGVEIARAAAAIRSVLELLSSAIEEVRLAVGVVATRIRAISAELRVILTRRMEQAQLAGQVDRGAIQIRGVRSAEDVSPEVPPPLVGQTEVAAVDDIEDAAKGLPDLVVPRDQVESKFKHAKAFGVTKPRGRAGFDEFSRTVSDFIRSPETTRVVGTYRNQSVILNYDRTSDLVIVQRLNGEFVSGWKMSSDQATMVYEKGMLGGG